MLLSRLEARDSPVVSMRRLWSRDRSSTSSGWARRTVCPREARSSPRAAELGMCLSVGSAGSRRHRARWPRALCLFGRYALEHGPTTAPWINGELRRRRRISCTGIVDGRLVRQATKCRVFRRLGIAASPRGQAGAHFGSGRPLAPCRQSSTHAGSRAFRSRNQDMAMIGRGRCP